MSANGAASIPPIDPAVAVGDPNVIRSLQHFLTLAQSGQLAGVAIVAIDQHGNAMQAPVIPQNPAALHIVLGALYHLMRSVDDMLDQFRGQVAASPIIKPNGILRPQ